MRRFARRVVPPLAPCRGSAAPPFEPTPAGPLMARQHMLRVRASAAEREHWQALAAAAGMPLSDLVRLSLGYVRPWSPGDRAEAAERSRQIAWAGNNLNQIARRVNAAEHPQRLEILSELAAIEAQLAALLPEGDRPC